MKWSSLTHGPIEFWMDLECLPYPAELKEMIAIYADSGFSKAMPDIHAKAGNGKLCISLSFRNDCTYWRTHGKDLQYVSDSVDKAFTLAQAI